MAVNFYFVATLALSTNILINVKSILDQRNAKH